MKLSRTELQQYDQQIKLSEIGIEGQLKLKQARVLCVGAGGLGCPLLQYLTAAGVGTLGIIDFDRVERSNLHRQILYAASDIGKPKALVAKARLSAQNPEIIIHTHTEKLTLSNARELIDQYDIVADCSDNFTTRYLINDVCTQLNKPTVFASIAKFEGQCAVFLRKGDPCLRCVFPHPELVEAPNCSESGVLGVLPGLLGVIQANEILKWILKTGESLSKKLLTLNCLTMEFKKFQITQNPECKTCVLKQPVTLLNLPDNCLKEASISLIALKEKLQKENKIFLLDVRSVEERDTYHMGGVLIPLPELENRLSELKRDDEIVVYCHSGKRSLQAVALLKENHFQTVSYLEGGCREVEINPPAAGHPFDKGTKKIGVRKPPC